MKGYSIITNRVVIAWCSRSQKTVTLSVTESEYSATTEVCCKIIFVHAVLLFVVVIVEYSITVHIDNIGNIFLSDNTSVSQWTKHIDVCCHFVRDYVEDGTVKIEFVRSEENLADPFTKNLSNGPFEYLTSRYVHRE